MDLGSVVEAAKSDVKLDAFKHVDESTRATDLVAYVNAREQRVREQAIAHETVRLVRQELAECYNREGVNHYQNCKHVAKKYYDLITAPGFGVLQPPEA